MKRNIILIGLVGVNCILGAAIALKLFKIRQPEPPIPAASIPPPVPNGEPGIAQGDSSKTGIVARQVQSASSAFHWKHLHSRDYRQFIANLRVVHCPEETIQDIIIAAVNKDFARREVALKLRPEHLAPWEGTAGSDNFDPDRLNRLADLLTEKKTLLFDLLGVDVPVEMPTIRSESTNSRLEMALQSIPPEKRAEVRKVQEEYWRQIARLDRLTGGEYDIEDFNQRKQIIEQRRLALKSLLNQDQMAALELGTSSSSRNETAFRRQFAIVGASDQELREIMRLKARQQELMPPSGPGGDPEMNRAWSESYQQTEENIKTMLGEDRYRQYQKAQDSRYARLQNLTQQFNLPTEAIEKAYELEILNAGRPRMRTQEEMAQWQAQRNEVEVNLQKVLGPDAYKAYRGGTSRLVETR